MTVEISDLREVNSRMSERICVESEFPAKQDVHLVLFLSLRLE